MRRQRWKPLKSLQFQRYEFEGIIECCCLSCVKTVKKETYNTHVGKAIKWENALPLCKALRGASSQRALLFFLCHCLCPHFIVFRNTRTKLTRRLITTKENIISIHEKEKSSNRFAKTIFEKPDCDTRYLAQCHASRLKISEWTVKCAGCWLHFDNLSKPITSILILYTLTSVCTFSKLFLNSHERRILLTVNSFFSWWSFPLFSWPKCLIQGRYCKEIQDASHSEGLKGLIVKKCAW